MAMAMWTMVASGTWLHYGVFTPLYAIATIFLSPHAQQVSEHAGGWWWATGPALVGGVIHMVDSMALGAIFAMMVALLRLRGPALLMGAMIYALAAMGILTSVGVAIGATNLGTLFHWWVWTVGHLMFGAVLGLWVLMQRRRLTAPVEEAVALPRVA
jgi:ABC-type spermidine/putrescine transport system permease subunit II